MRSRVHRYRSSRLASVSFISLPAIALVGALGAVPAAAQGLITDPEPTVVYADAAALPAVNSAFPWDRDRDRDKNKDRDGDGCFDIDTVRQEAAGGGAFYAATSGGIAYVGYETSPLGNIEWNDLSDEGGDVPEGACGVSIDVGPTSQGSDVVVDVITTAGTVHTITCDRMGSVITDCGTWVQRDTPTPGDG
ncbi:hypothetical protein [Streptomyces sp. NPDC019507]|uniref:hypothetical protein n=1 Tax=Streptomyces sp. NPDC019507 TaxID=3154689 RepID=UPI0034089F3A